MKLSDDIDFTALNWVKHELDETLKQSRQALESYVEDASDESLMRTCAAQLHQVQGTLRMVELYGAAMVVEEMERLAEALLAGSVTQREEAYSVLMRGMVQLPDYLERVQSGYKDIPIVLLPLLNDLRACRGEKLLTESALFAPDLDAILPEDAAGSASPVPAAQLRMQVIRLRLAFQAALLKWFREEHSSEYPDRLLDVLDRLRALSFAQPARRLWWVAAGVIEALRDRSLESSIAVKLLFGRVDREIRHFAESGESVFGASAARELVQNLLYYVAHSTGGGARVSAIRASFRLDSLLPTETELEHAQGSMTGHNRSLLDTVSIAIKDDLLRVKEALDIFLRAHAQNPAELLVQAEVLDRVGDTLGMLGLGVPRRVVGEQRTIIEAIASGRRPADESSLLDVAGALLYVEASLDDHIEQLGAGRDGPALDDEHELPRAEVRKILDTLMHEAAVNIQQAKHDIIAFIEAPWDHDRVEPIPRLLEEIAGALRMLDFNRAAQLMNGIVRFVEVELISRRRVPSAEQMDTLADALASIEYYLEATREQRSGRERILDVTRNSLERLGYWPPVADAASEPAAGDAQRARADRFAAHQEARAPASKPTVPTDEGEALLWGAQPFDPSGESLRFHDIDAGGAGQHPAFDDAPDAAAAQIDDAPATPRPPIEHAPIEHGPIEHGPIEHGPELSSAVDIAPGHDLNDLVIGASGTSSVPTQDVAGLRFDASPEDDDDAGWIEQDVDEEMAGDDALAAGFQTNDSGDIDDDIRAVFVEEVEDEIKRIRRQFGDWQTDIDDFEKLKPLRRSFHTLKGSGRLVGAVALGEFSWKIEHLLNRVLDKAVLPGAAVQALIAHALDALPELLKGLRGELARVHVAPIMTTADRLAAGEEAWLPDATTTTRNVRRHMRRDAGNDGAAASADHATRDAHSALPLQAHIDPVLFDILKTEVATHVAAIGEYLEACRAQPVVPNEAVSRAVHTLAGAIAMVDIATLASVLGPLEGYVKRLRAAAQPPSADGLARIGDAAALVREVMHQLESGASALPDAGELATQMAALRDSLPESTTAFGYSTGEAEIDQADDEADVVTRATPAPDESPVDDEHLANPPDTLALTDVDAMADDAMADAADRAPTTSTADAGASMSPTAGDQAFALALDSALDAALIASTDADETTPTTQIAQTTDATADTARDNSTTANATDTDDADRRESARDVDSLPSSKDLASRDPSSAADLDEDLLEIFVQEGADILDHSDSLMASLRKEAGDAAALAGLQRDLHTLKGGSRMAGIAPVADLAHAMESLLEAIDEDRHTMDRAAIEALERGFDELHRLMQGVARHQAIDMPIETIARFAALVGEPLDSVDGEGTAAPREAPIETVTASAETTPTAPLARQLPTLDEEEIARAPQEMIRVRSDLLDSLVNYAGEVSIYRSRLEQQVSSFRFNLVEFEQTVARLREQLRKLEIETEAQIIARFQREHQEGLASFDPLELDRYSQLQQYSRALGESVSDLVSIQGLLDDITRQSETLLLQQSRVSSDLQEGLMRTRMVPFDSLVPSLRRTLRQAAQDMGRQAQLRVEGAQGEMDRNLLERMKAPFEHMLRNALAHGIEPPADRLAAGKPVEGAVNIAVSRDATEVVLRVSDDGRGMDRDAIRAKAIERGLLNPDVQLSDRDLYGFVLESGFSTVDRVTQLAGRGVGMDVVHNEIKQLGGSLRIDSEAGRGTAFTLRLPFTLAVTQAIMVRLGESVYAIPMSSVQGVVRIERADLERRLASGAPSYDYAGETYTLYELSQLLGVPAGYASDETQVPLLMTRTGDQRAGVRIDAVVGSREIVVKSVGPQISSVPGVFGATIMGDGSVVMILDLAPLVRRTTALRERVAGGELSAMPQAPIAPAEAPRRRQPLIMVVDDSITMRKVTTRVLERADMDVFTAKDGLDAVEKLQERIPDLMLLDIEMPRMDGYELATYMKNDSRLKHVPIIMITSRTGEKHRQRALEIGVERYLGKPYQEADLVQNVQETLRSAGAEA